MSDDHHLKALQKPDSEVVELDIVVNGERRQSRTPGDVLLVDYLHEHCRLTGTKFSCGVGACGACKVAVRAQPGGPWIPVLACFARVSAINHMEIHTVEGLAQSGALHPLQVEFLNRHAFQCGYSTPGFLMAGYVLIDQLKRWPIREADLDATVQSAIGGHICRCTGYERYVQSITTVIRGMVDRGELKWADQVKPRTSAGVHFYVVKQSANDVSKKQVFGWFESVKVDLDFEDFGDISSLSGTLELAFDDLRTGIQVRDLNLLRFLLAPFSGARFKLGSSANFDETQNLYGVGRGGRPVKLGGHLELMGGRAKRPSTRIDCLALLSEEESGWVKVTSIAPISLDLSAMGLPVERFAREFGLRLNSSVEVSIDLKVRLGEEKGTGRHFSGVLTAAGTG